jgi:glycerol-3-phosphate cytidylyltransferase
MLEECSRYCDHLTIGINTAVAFDESINPGKRRPFFTAEERKKVITSVRYVDEVIFYESEASLTEILEKGDFDVRFLGDDYRGKPITAPSAVQKIHYVDRSHGYSTSGVLNRIRERMREGET